MESLQLLLKWLSNLDPARPPKVNGLSNRHVTKLDALKQINDQADSDIDEVISCIELYMEECNALCESMTNALPLNGVVDPYDLSGSTLRTLEESAEAIQSGIVGDGTTEGAALQHTANLLESVAFARKECNLKGDVKKLSRKNVQLKQTISFFEKEDEAASKELKELKPNIDNIVKYSFKSLNSTRVEFENPVTKYVALRAQFSKMKNIKTENDALEGQLKEFHNLSANILEARDQLKKVKEEQARLSEALKLRFVKIQKAKF